MVAPVYIVVCPPLVSESKLQLATMAALFSLSLLLWRIGIITAGQRVNEGKSEGASLINIIIISSYPWRRWKRVGAQPLSRSKQALLFPLDKSELGRKGAQLGQKAVKIGQIIWCWRAGSEKFYAQFFNSKEEYKMQMYTKYKHKMPWTEMCQIRTNHPMLDQKNAMHNSSTETQNTKYKYTQNTNTRCVGQNSVKIGQIIRCCCGDQKDITLLKIFSLLIKNLKSLLFRFGTWVGGRVQC